MTDKPKSTDLPEEQNPSDTLIVPPPNFKARLLAAQRARANEIRPSVGIPIPPHIPGEFPLQPTNKPINSAAIPVPTVVPVAEQTPKAEAIPAPAAPTINDGPAKPASTEPAAGNA